MESINSLRVSENLLPLTVLNLPVVNLPVFNLPCDILKIICSYAIEPKYKFIDIITNNILKYNNLKRKEFILDLVLNQNIDILNLLDKLIDQTLTFNSFSFNSSTFNNLSLNNEFHDTIFNDLFFWIRLSVNSTAKFLLYKYWNILIDNIDNDDKSEFMYIFECIASNNDLVPLLKIKWNSFNKTNEFWLNLAKNINAIDLLIDNWDKFQKTPIFWENLATNTNAIELIINTFDENTKHYEFWLSISLNKNAIDFILDNWIYIIQYKLDDSINLAQKLAYNKNGVIIINKYLINHKWNLLSKSKIFWEYLSSNPNSLNIFDTYWDDIFINNILSLEDFIKYGHKNNVLPLITKKFNNINKNNSFWVKEVKPLNRNYRFWECVAKRGFLIDFIVDNFNIINKTQSFWENLAFNDNAIDLLKNNWELIDKTETFYNNLLFKYDSDNVIQLIELKWNTFEKTNQFLILLSTHKKGLKLIKEHFDLYQRLNLYSDLSFRDDIIEYDYEIMKIEEEKLYKILINL